MGDKPEGLARFQPPPKAPHAKVVQSRWLEDCLSQQARLDEHRYTVDIRRRLQETEKGKLKCLYQAPKEVS